MAFEVKWPKSHLDWNQSKSELLFFLLSTLLVFKHSKWKFMVHIISVLMSISVTFFLSLLNVGLYRVWIWFRRIHDSFHRLLIMIWLLFSQFERHIVLVTIFHLKVMNLFHVNFLLSGIFCFRLLKETKACNGNNEVDVRKCKMLRNEKKRETNLLVKQILNRKWKVCQATFLWCYECKRLCIPATHAIN